MLTSFRVKKGVELPVYWSEHAKNESSTHAIIVIHGSLRDGDSYWTTLNQVKEQELGSKNPSVDPNLIITAPEFYSSRLNKGLYSSSQLAWGDLNLWQMGAESNHPQNAKVSSFAAIEALIKHFDDRKAYPRMKNVTLVGHSGGAQFVNRYVTVVPYNPKHVHVRYLVADPSSSVYFTRHRPITDPSYVDLKNCTAFNDWRYGFHNFSIAPYAGKPASHYFHNYVSRDVVNLNGMQDTELNGDQQCMAIAQGGSQRIARNMAWWKYINLLAGTDEDVSFYPGNFSELPNWRRFARSGFNVRMSAVANATHKIDEVFSSAEGVSALFDAANLNPGWRPTQPMSIPALNSSDSLIDSNNDSDSQAPDFGSLASSATMLRQSCAIFTAMMSAVILSVLIELL